MKVIERCETCRTEHELDFDPRIGPIFGFSEWIQKHAGHEIRFEWPQRSAKQVPETPHWGSMQLNVWGVRQERHEDPGPDPWGEEVKAFHGGWLKYLHNADVKVAYAASAAVTISLNSLGASSTHLAGRSGAAIDNGASVKMLDYYFAGSYTADNTNNQAGRILTCAYGAINDTPTWPDISSATEGTDAAMTITDQGTFDTALRVISDINADNTASQVWPFGPVTIVPHFGCVPDQFALFVAHSIQTETNAWESSGHSIYGTGVYATVS